MLRINEHQAQAFRSKARSEFEHAMVAHCRSFSPRLTEILGQERVLKIVRMQIERAASYGFSLRGPVRLYIELGLLFGTFFDKDVQYPWARSILTDTVSPEMSRAEQLYGKCTEAVLEIHGLDNRFTRAALTELQKFAEEHGRPERSAFSAFALATMQKIHPEKCGFLGEEPLRALIGAAQNEAGRHGLEEPAESLLLTALMFSFGQHCTMDPLYPWIGSTLANERLSAPTIRARQLKKKSLTWLRHVLQHLEAIQ